VFIRSEVLRRASRVRSHGRDDCQRIEHKDTETQRQRDRIRREEDRSHHEHRGERAIARTDDCQISIIWQSTAPRVRTARVNRAREPRARTTRANRCANRVCESRVRTTCESRVRTPRAACANRAVSSTARDAIDRSSSLPIRSLCLCVFVSLCSILWQSSCPCARTARSARRFASGSIDPLRVSATWISGNRPARAHEPRALLDASRRDRSILSASLRLCDLDLW
jgi:hypothetical protein